MVSSSPEAIRPPLVNVDAVLPQQRTLPGRSSQEALFERTLRHVEYGEDRRIS